MKNKKHDAPAESARVCYNAVPGFISMGEVKIAIEKYNRE